MKALITGIAGQDGSYLTEHLLAAGCEVHGMIRRHSIAESQHARIEGLPVTFHYGDMTDQTSIERILSDVMPDRIFNLAAQSHVRISFEIPQYTVQVNALGVVNLLEAVRRLCPQARVYQASSSEMFGLSVDPDGYQRETTPLVPTSPYGCAKVLAYNMMRHYRRAYKMFCSNGILFNHESPRRGSNFVTQKVVHGAVEIRLGVRQHLLLGNLDSCRDWGHSKDYTRAMLNILEQDEPDDFVVATGETHSVREMCEVVFSYLDLDYMKYVGVADEYKRPEELPYLRGDASKARRVLGWEPSYTFRGILEEMVDATMVRQYA